jgi:signal transduction histidine kinase
MTRLRTFLKKHALIAGGIAVLIPLIIIYYLQFRTLKTLGQTLPAYRTQVLNQFLGSVIREVAMIYSENSERALAVPAQAIKLRQGAIIQHDKDRALSLEAVEQVAEHFKKQDFKGARRYFIAVATENEGIQGSEIFFYDPESQKMVIDANAPEMVAINVVSAPYMVYIRAGRSLIPYSVGVERDTLHRMIVKPVHGEPDKENEPGKLIAVAGMVLDHDLLFEKFLPEAIRKSASKLLPTEDRDALVALRMAGKILYLYDGQGNRLEPSQDEAKIEPESIQPFYFILTNTRLSIRLKDLTVGQWAKRNFIVNLVAWSVMSIFLLAAIAMMIRTAAREMKLTQTKADFVSNVSHELRTPLASIRVLAELLNLGRVTEGNKVREYGGYIESEGRRLTQLINNILDFSRIESGKKGYNFEQADVKEVVDETLEAFSLQLKRHGFNVDYQAPKRSLPEVTIDPDAIALVLTNLLDNAIKYSKTEKRISIRLDHKDDFVTVAISDQGIGIARVEQEKIFEKFYRVSTGLVHDVKGSGLGLSLVKHIVEAHRGKITVESDSGKGSTFTLYLPVNGQWFHYSPKDKQ